MGVELKEWTHFLIEIFMVGKIAANGFEMGLDLHKLRNNQRKLNWIRLNLDKKLKFYSK